MAKEQKKELTKIIVISIILLIISVSIIFTKPISKFINRILIDADIQTGNNDMVVHFIDVGQGDAIAIKLPNNEIMVIDSGTKDSQNYLVEYLKDNVLMNNKDLVVDYLFLTHSDIDHSGGMCAIFAEFEVKNFYRPNIASKNESLNNFDLKTDTEEYDEVIALSKQEKSLNVVTLNQEIKFNIDKVLVEIFSPLDIYDTTNEMSSVIKLTYCNKSFLFTGDIGGNSEEDMLTTHKERLNCDVLKVAHHGSKESTSEEFVNTVTPEYAVICVGENSYGHPHFTVVSRLENAGAEVLTTKNSTVRFICNQNGLSILDKNAIYSTEYIKWWAVALSIDLILAICLIRIIIDKILKSKKANMEV